MTSSQETFISHDGHRIACIAHRNGSATKLPVVWLHGLTMSVRFWEEGMFAPIERERSWYSISLPLHHPCEFDRPITSDTLSEDLFAELLSVAIDHLVPDGKVHLVGHSLGGFAALNYAAKYPERVASVVSVGGFMTGRAKGVEGMLQFMSKGRFLRKAIFYTGFFILQRHVKFLKLAALSYAKDRQSLLKNPKVDPTLRSVFPDVSRHIIKAQRAFCQFLIEMDLMDEIESIEVPVLVMAGDRDPIIPYEHQVKCAERLPEGELFTLEGVGHLPFAESPEIFEEKLIRWLEERERE